MTIKKVFSSVGWYVDYFELRMREKCAGRAKVEELWNRLPIDEWCLDAFVCERSLRSCRTCDEIGSAFNSSEHGLIPVRIVDRA